MKPNRCKDTATCAEWMPENPCDTCPTVIRSSPKCHHCEELQNYDSQTEAQKKLLEHLISLGNKSPIRITTYYSEPAVQVILLLEMLKQLEA